MLYIDENGKWIDGPVPKHGSVIVHRVRKTFADVCLYYANIIDYFRILMALVALILILHLPHWRYSIASLIMGSVLLDWIDGPVARHYGQSTVMGCGWDWLADLLAQYCLAIWCLDHGTPITTFVVLFSTVEIATGIFDFAVSAQAVYPTETTVNQPWYLIVEDWLTPNQTYNHLGTACWLINTAYPIAYCLDLPLWFCYLLMPFAVLYAWHEVCQLIFIVGNWRETTAQLQSREEDDGIHYQRPCKEEEVYLLKKIFEECRVLFKIPKREETKIYWVNLFHNGQPHPKLAQDGQWSDMNAWIGSLMKEFWPGQTRVLLSCGFIISPGQTNEDQQWHHDYGRHVSNLFIPLTPVTVNNSTQYLRHPHGRMKINADDENEQNYPSPETMLDEQQVDYLELCQPIVRPFSILKLAPGTVHRGIANRELTDRILFFVCTNDKAMDLQESYGMNYEQETVQDDPTIICPSETPPREGS
jgi:phosphatidylglycerophosphate synthase